MTKQELYELLDMETGADFRYFENIADLFESDRNIDADVLYELLTDIDLSDFAELCENYFEQTTDFIPGQDMDMYNLMDNIKRSMIGLSSSISSTSEVVKKGGLLLKLSDEIHRFREWYCFRQNVECTPEDGTEKKMLPVRDALFVVREEKVGGIPHRFDFSEALDYTLDEYVMSFADLADIGEVN